MKITETNTEELSSLGLRGRPRDYTKSKYYPAIEQALKGKVMCINFDTSKQAAACYNSINGMLRRNKIPLTMSLRLNNIYLYKK